MKVFKDRKEAGRLLATELKNLKVHKAVILGLVRGGVVVAYEMAKALNLPLDVLVVKKIGAPGNEELAIGAVGPDEVVVWDKELCQRLGVDKKVKGEKLKVKSEERQGKESFLRRGKPPSDLLEKTVVLTDDGIATGATAEAAIKWIKTQKPEKIILAIPVAPPEVVRKLKLKVDKLICLKIEPDFWAVGQFYQEFPQVSDQEVAKLLVNSN